LIPRSVLNAGGGDIAKTWLVVHLQQKHDLSPSLG